MYKYTEILDETYAGIQLLIETDHGFKSPWLAKKRIGLFRHSKEVAIPEWLCRATKLELEINPEVQA